MAMNSLRTVVVNGFPLIGLVRPTYVNARVLAASTAEAFTVPTGAKYVLLTANVDFWANFTTTAAVPAADITDGSSPVLNPCLRILDGCASISVISVVAGIVTAEFYM
jgi:hypothetical protein